MTPECRNFVLWVALVRADGLRRARTVCRVFDTTEESERMEINELLRYAVERGASDLHLKVGNVPFIRVDGDLQPTQFPSLTASDTEAFGMELMSDHKKREFEASSEADLGVTLAPRSTAYRSSSLISICPHPSVVANHDAVSAYAHTIGTSVRHPKHQVAGRRRRRRPPNAGRLESPR